ncbi:hypothetical protein M3Y95_01272500 [Aphelenchoides besseyi]|nr:hypothetical protein M3Y95_01272500 [Aphelenchoides besseyi]
MILKLLYAAFYVFLLRFIWKLGRWIGDLEYQRRLCSRIPGPESLPLIGSLHKVPKDDSKVEEWFVEEANKVIRSGGNVMKLWICHELRIYLLDSEAVKPLINSTEEIVKGRDYGTIKRWMGEGLLTSHGDKWVRQRKLLTPAFHFAKLEEYSGLIDDHVQKFVEILSHKADGQEINFHHYVKYLTLDIIMQTTMGVNLDLQEQNDHPYVKAVDKFADLELRIIQNPFLHLPGAMWLSGIESEMRKTIKILKSFSSQIINERLKSNRTKAKKRPDFLDLLLEQMDSEELTENVDTFLFAGHDTTAHAISWTIWCLATNPSAQDRLYVELSENTNLRESKYLDAVIKESMRLYPPVPFVERQLKAEMQIGKHRLPRGSNVVIPQLLLHHNEKIFNDHWSFDPNRFLNDRVYPPTSYLPFSAGLRNCIGQRFAMIEVRCVLAHLIRNFEFSSDYQMQDNWTLAEMVLRPGIGIPTRLHKRL